jgi:hypothetical protein
VTAPTRVVSDPLDDYVEARVGIEPLRSFIGKTRLVQNHPRLVTPIRTPAPGCESHATEAPYRKD